MTRSVKNNAAAMLCRWVYFSTIRAITSVPPLEAPTLKSNAEAMAGSAMAKISSSMGWSDKGALSGQAFSNSINSAESTTVA